MSDNQEIEKGNGPSSDPDTMDDLFLSPDDSQAEEIEFAAGSEPESNAAGESLESSAASVDPAPLVDSAAIAELEAERDDYRNRMMRVAADLENFRKRTAREKADMRKYGIDRVVLELLPVIDNLERALEHADKSEDSTTIVDGVRMVHRQFITALEKHGVRGFDSKGEQFDPQKHEAIQQIDTTDHPTGHVLEEYQKGYYLHERLIRPALVVVARNPEGAPMSPALADAVSEADGPADPEAADESSDLATSADPGADDEATDQPSSSPSEDSDGSDDSAVN